MKKDIRYFFRENTVLALQTNFASVGCAFKRTRNVKVLSLRSTSREVYIVVTSREVYIVVTSREVYIVVTSREVYIVVTSREVYIVVTSLLTS